MAGMPLRFQVARYKELAGNQTARDFSWFYFSSIFQGKYPGAAFIAARGNPLPTALNDSPVYRNKKKS